MWNVAFAGDFYDESVQYGNTNIEPEREDIDAWSANGDDINIRKANVEDDEKSIEELPRKRVRIRVPVVHNKTAQTRQHKLTVVRRRPVASHTKDLAYASTTHAPRRIVVTRVRTLGLGNSIYPTDIEDLTDQSSSIRHKVTITRRRKLQSKLIPSTSSKHKIRVTRKKLVAVRPISPTSTFAIITTGFFTAPSFDYNEEYSDEKEEQKDEVVNEEDPAITTPRLEETPNLIDNKPDVEASLVLEGGFTALSEESMSNTPVIITDNFFFPASDDEQNDGSNEEYNHDYLDLSTTTENIDNIAILMKDVQYPQVMSSVDEDNSVSNKSDIEMWTENDDTIMTTPMNQITLEKSSEEQAKKIQEFNVISTNMTASHETVSTTVDTLKEILTTTIPVPIDEDRHNKSAMKEHTTITSFEEQTTFKSDITTLNALDEPIESTTSLNEENTMHNATETYGSLTEMTMLDKDKDQELIKTVENSTESSTMTQTISEILDEILTVQPIQLEVEAESNSTLTSVVETILPSDSTITPGYESVIPLETTKLSMHDIDMTSYFDSYIPSVIPLSANYTREIKLSVFETSVLETSPVTKVTTKIASPTPEEIEAGLADDLYLSLSRLDFPEILPSKPATIDLMTESMSNLALEPSTSVYYTETVVTSTRLRTYTYVVTQLNGLETKVTSSTTVRPRVTTLTLTVPITVTVTPIVESSANVIASVYNPVPVAGE